MDKKQGRVIFQAKDTCKILVEDQVVIGRVSGGFRNQVEKLADYPMVGDWVSGFLYDQDQFLIEAITPRTSFLQRKVAGNRQDEQGIAANITTVFVTTSVNEEFNIPRLERFTTIVWDSGAQPVFVLTKTDQVTSSELAIFVNQLETFFVGIPIITTTKYEDNLDKFSSYLLPGSIVAFIGSSGVGKSTLLNQFLGVAIQATKDIRLEDARGRHTTTSRELFLLPNGGMVIDTPGMREIGLMTVQASALEQQYQSIYELAATCRFADCHHVTEPGCQVKAALATGELSEEVWHSYQKMEKEIAYLQKKERYQLLKAGKKQRR